MSASERLRALDGAMTEGPWRETGWSLVDWDAHGRDRDALLALRNALPLIADCIEGAEGMIDSRFNPERWKWNRENLVTALAKLEEHLNGN